SFGHEFRLTETMIISPTTVNETRFQYEFDKNQQKGDDSTPGVNVSDAFFGGGAQIGLNFNKSQDIEVTNITTTTLAKTHGIKFGGRIHHITVDNRSESNYGGTFTFPGFRVINDPADPNDDVVTSPLEQYRQKVMGNPSVLFNPVQ